MKKDWDCPLRKKLLGNLCFKILRIGNYGKCNSFFNVTFLMSVQNFG